MKCLYLLSVVFHVAAGCELVKKAGLEEVTGIIGESVVLPCVCTDLQDKPKSVKWEFLTTKSGKDHYQEIYPEQTEHYRNRVKLVSKNPPGNLSLPISDLTEEDQGKYRCSIHGSDASKYIRLSVKASSATPEQDKQQTYNSLPIVFGSMAVLLLVIPSLVAFLYWKHKGGRCGQNVVTEGRPDCKGKQKDQTETEVHYSSVTHINTAGAARVQINTGEKTEYASIIN